MINHTIIAAKNLRELAVYGMVANINICIKNHLNIQK